MEVQIINPLSDDRWNDLVQRHPRSSAFHQVGWLQALQRTYGYEPYVLTSTPAGEPLRDGVVFCRVSSWLTGTRLVSLPFADHCDLLLERLDLSAEFSQWLKAECERLDCQYVEFRPRVSDEAYGFPPGRSFYFHELDLSPSLEHLFNALHKDSIQRKIRRAEKEGLVYESGNSSYHVDEFYRQLLITRRRHKLFPQPKIWFRNLIACMGENVQIKLARRQGATVAAMLTTRHRSSVIYKYGCSDEKMHNLGGMAFLYWKLIEESKASGASEIDFGRSDLDNPGLVTFKDRFGTRRKLLTYRRYTNPKQKKKDALPDVALMQRFFPILPDVALSVGGRLLYKHMG